MDTKQIETKIIELLIDDALAAGYYIDVNDGEETTLRVSADKAAILAATWTTDETYFIVRNNEEKRLGFIRLIHGNGADVVSDYADRPALHELVKGANEVAESLYGEWADLYDPNEFRIA